MASMDFGELVDRVRISNAQARGARERWAGHRERVMGVLRGLPLRGARVALLGAGHLHDVELGELLRECARVSLVDLDAEAVTSAVDRQPAAGWDEAAERHEALARHEAASRCVVHAPVDLTGVLQVLPEARNGTHGVEHVLSCLADSHCEIPEAPFDVTVSLGALTQLMQAVSDVGARAEDVPRLSLAVRDKHLRDLAHLTRPGGTLVLVTDFVSTRTAHDLLDLPPHELEPRLARLVAAGNFFTGTNPYRIIALLEEMGTRGCEIESARLEGPWLWAITPDRQHLTGAIVARRRNS